MSVFDVQAETKAPTRIEFRGNESRWEALFYLGFGGMAVAYLLSKGGWAAIIAGGVVGCLFLLLAFGKALGELDRSIHLVFDVEGITAPHAFVRKVPWDAVQSYSFDPNRDAKAVLVHLAEPARFELKRTDPLNGGQSLGTAFTYRLIRLLAATKRSTTPFGASLRRFGRSSYHPRG